jgi:hypothetical protein
MSDETTQLEKVTDEELAELRQKREVLFNTSDSITKAYLTQQKCADDLARFRSIYDLQAKDFNEVQKAITEKYGEINVDLQTGVITYDGSN